MNKVVYVVGGDPLVEKMFEKRGWAVTSQNGLFLETHSPTLVCFTGGEDVSPEIYGETNQGSRGCNLSRDQEEVEVFNHYKSVGVPMVGICRGGQLLNVLNGGKMIQDLGRTVSGEVVLKRWLSDWDCYIVPVVVDHHQGMKRGVSFAQGQYALGDSRYPEVTAHRNPEYVLYYPGTRSLCFQPHPEWGHKGTEALFFDLIQEYIG